MGIMSFLSAAKNAKGNNCPYCHKPLKNAEENMPDGLQEEEMWQTVYTTFFIPVRRARMICTNPKCKHNFMETHHKFVKNLVGDRWVLEHWWQDAIYPPTGNKRKNDEEDKPNPRQKADVEAEERGQAKEQSQQNNMQKAEASGGGENSASAGGQTSAGANAGGELGGRYVGQNPLAGTSGNNGGGGASSKIRSGEDGDQDDEDDGQDDEE